MSHVSQADPRLPGEAPGITRWTVTRKARLLADLDAGRLTEAQAFERHGFTAEEIQTWRGRVARHGALGLSQTRIQVIR